MAENQVDVDIPGRPEDGGSHMILHRLGILTNHLGFWQLSRSNRTM
jgi:hypothetical protein